MNCTPLLAMLAVNRLISYSGGGMADSGGCVIRNRAAERRMIWPFWSNHRRERLGQLDTAGAQRITPIAVASF